MAEALRSAPRRVYLPHALGANEHLRATWHPDHEVVVFSHWDGERCRAATPVPIRDATELITLLVRALGEAADRQSTVADDRPTGRTRRSARRSLGTLTERWRQRRGLDAAASRAPAQPSEVEVPLRWKDSAQPC